MWIQQPTCPGWTSRHAAVHKTHFGMDAGKPIHQLVFNLIGTFYDIRETKQLLQRWHKDISQQCFTAVQIFKAE